MPLISYISIPRTTADGKTEYIRHNLNVEECSDCVDDECNCDGESIKSDEMDVPISGENLIHLLQTELEKVKHEGGDPEWESELNSAIDQITTLSNGV